MLAAEDTAATPAVMASFEKGELLLAGWRVAVRSRRVRLVSGVSTTLVERGLKSSNEYEIENWPDVVCTRAITLEERLSGIKDFGCISVGVMCPTFDAPQP